MRTITKKKKIAIAATAVVLVSGGTAFAYWSTTGAGTGSATTGTTQPISVTQTSVITDLRPGAAAQTLAGTFTNPNATPVYVASVTPTVTVTRASGAVGTCSAADYLVTAAPVNAEISTGTTWTGASIQFNNTTANQDGCKGATVAISYAVT
jgi:hypothetical protein